MANTEQVRPSAAAPRGVWIGRLLLYCGISVYLEVCLHLCVFREAEIHIVYPILFGVMTGVFTALVTSLFPRVTQRLLALVLVLLQVILAETQLIYHAVFGNLMPISQVTMGGAVAEFLDQTLFAIRQNLLQVLLLLLPLALLVVLMCCKRLRVRLGARPSILTLIVLFLTAGLTFGLMHLACSHPVPVWEIFRDSGTSTDMSYRNVGMTATTVQELRYLLLGEENKSGITWQENGAGEAKTYDPAEWNVMPELDFNALAASTDDAELAALDRFIGAKEPSRKNDYTGLLQGCNVIVICAESYSPLFVSEELTPTLYKMSHSGLVFENYYGTFNSMTTNGEYTLCLSLYPDMSRTKAQSSFDASVGHLLPLCLGTILKDYGYSTWAYHNNNGEFYNRSQTHVNMGYTFQAQGSGLDITPARPASDLELMEQSVDDFLSSEEPFHAYYMTYSGHYHYSWTNAMSAKNRAAVEHLPYSETVASYVACNLELEYAMAYLEQRLAEAGKLDNTLIVLTNDHYPYGLSAAEYNELAGREIDTSFEKYHNHFICYSPSLETVTISDYCSTADILPTLLNLLGVEYDARLLAGTDVLSDSEHIAILADGSFLTEGFRYCETTGELVTEPGVEVSPETLKRYRALVADRFTYSREILNTDYYAHVFPDASAPGAGMLEIPFDDHMRIRVQANCLFIYRKGLMDLYAERMFGPDENAVLGVYCAALYRFYGSPAVNEDALPEALRGDETLKQNPNYPACCWAYEQGILQPEDRVQEIDAVITNVEICLLLQRSAERFGWTIPAVDPEWRPLAEIHNEGITAEERAAVEWAWARKLLVGNGTQDDLFDDKEENNLNRYRLVLLLMMFLYPEMTR